MPCDNSRSLCISSYFQKEITVSRITEFNISHKRPPFLDLTELGRHQLVKLGIAWELVYKRHKGAANFE